MRMRRLEAQYNQCLSAARSGRSAKQSLSRDSGGGYEQMQSRWPRRSNAASLRDACTVRVINERPLLNVKSQSKR